MRLITKTTLHLGISAVLMIAVLVAVTLPFAGLVSRQAMEPHSRTVATMARDILTQGMVQDNLTEKKQLLQNLAGNHGIHSIHLTPGPGVRAAPGGERGSGRTPSPLEREVLRTGKAVFDSGAPGVDGLFTAVIPYKAELNSNCLGCHQVEPGTVLGTITVRMSVAEHWRAALAGTVIIIATIAISALLAVLYLRRVLAPVASTAQEVEEATELARQGNFRSVIQQRTDDEIGHIAGSMNHLLTFLKRSFSDLNNKVANLIQVPAHSTGNLLLATTELVENLIATAQFKQVIEEDENRDEVYGRLGEVIQGQFHHHRFSLYEVDAQKNRLIPVLVDGAPSDQCRWCDPQIQVRGDACRARRTGHVVRSSCEPGICPAFKPHPDEGVTEHVCIPINESGAVGNVVQLLGDGDTIGLTELYVPFIQMYLREAAPVIESKRLMDTLRETTLRDPMTGLHNRRFLEEFIAILVSQTDRAKSRFSVLMADLDYFKKVNDSYGHESGDKVLVALARTLTDAVRSSDLVVRYGGEEFLVVVRDTEPGGGDAVAEKLRKGVEDLRITIPGAELKKTVSIGVADYPDDGDSFWQVVKYADVALYRAKDEGRNRVLHFRPDMWEGAQDDY